MSKIENIVEVETENLSNEISELNYKIRVLIDKAYKGKVLKKTSDSYEYIESLINEFTNQGAYLKHILEHPEKVDLVNYE